MANRFQKGLSGAATGAALGGPIGGLIGGLGSLIFGGNDKTPELGEFQFSPESLRSYNFSDINMEQMNPELYKRLMENDAVLQGMREALASRREGATANEQRQLSDYLNAQGSGMASSGLAGTPMGNAMMADAAARMNAQMQDRAFQEYQALQGNVQNAAQQGFQNFSGAQGNLLNQLNQNRQNSLQMDQLRNQRDLGQYEQDQAALAASNAQWGGMLSGAMGMLGQGMDPVLGDVGSHLGNAYDWLKAQGPAPMGQQASPGYGMPAIMSPGGQGYGKGLYRQGYDAPKPQYASPGGQGYGRGLFR